MADNILKVGKENVINKVRKYLTLISPELNTKVSYFIIKKKKINLQEPETLDEKISWLKLNNYNENQLVIDCANKVSVRNYVESLDLTYILPKLYGIYSSVNEIDFNKLPNQFALKWNTGSGGNLICLDKEKDLGRNISRFKKWGDNWKRNKPYLIRAEMQYKYADLKIICEEYLGNEHTPLPDDYKFYCFNGEAKLVMICVDREKNKPRFYFFNRNWELQRINKDGISAPENFKLEKPAIIEEMFLCADKLSSPFPFVRTDLYNIDNRIVFGELTFTPSGGIDSNLPYEADLLLGSMLKL
ncbi:ATP-grasp fold amidoligase family protein [Fundicoccus sp. Sow4_F4]|uniref:ATP-grasp fold amidoligase family protein n=1 Tax=Fundicoccus sp. Sow4_F4 TaxID=3438783 RepID=UPI003F8F2979